MVDVTSLWPVLRTNTESSRLDVPQTNEVNQGDALEHNFSAMHAALMLPVTHLLHGKPLPQVSCDPEPGFGSGLLS